MKESKLEINDHANFNLLAFESINLIAFESWLLERKNYSYRTVANYVKGMRLMCKIFGYNINDRVLSDNSLISLTESFVNIPYSYRFLAKRALELFLEMSGNDVSINIISSKQCREKNDKLFIGVNDVLAYLSSIKNLKHRCILLCALGMGLRPSEIRSLRNENIDYKSKKIIIEGKCSRRVSMPEMIHKDLLLYNFNYSPLNFVFEGRNKGGAMTDKSLELIARSASEKAGYGSGLTLMALRRSFGIHLIELGYDCIRIQRYMGYANIKSVYDLSHYAFHKSIKLPVDLLT